MKFISVISIVIIFLGVFHGCDKQHNPVNSTMDGTAQLKGYILSGNNIIIAGEMIISGDGFSELSNVSTQNQYQFNDVPMGTYEIIPQGNNQSYTYHFFPDRFSVTVDNAYEMLPPILGVALHPGERAVAGFVRDNYGKPVHSIYIQLIADGELLATYDSKSISLYNDGSYMFKTNNPDVTECELIVKNGYRTEAGSIIDSLWTGDNMIYFTDTDTIWFDDYTFNPDTLMITLDRDVVFQDISAVYSGAARYSVSGYVSSLFDVNDYRISLGDPSTGKKYTGKIFSDGYYLIDDVPVGSYNVKIDSYRIIDESQQTITITGDTELPVIPLCWNDTNYIAVTGKLLDQSGNPITNARAGLLDDRGIMSQVYTTGADGIFEYQFETYPMNERDIEIKFEKNGVTFKEPVVTVHLDWTECVKDREIVIPDILGIDYSSLSADQYFPLDTIYQWTYSRTDINGEVTQNTVMISGPNDDNWFEMSPRGPAGYRKFRIAENDVNIQETNGVEGSLLKFGLVAGSSWNIVVGTPTQGTVIGVEDVTTPMGSFQHCLVIDIKNNYSTSSSTVYRLWLARDAGVVKTTRTTMTRGEIVEYFSEEVTEIEYR